MKRKTARKPAENNDIMAAPVRALLPALNAAGIAWCSWKSNQHLDAGVKGDTDLDLLFAKDAREKAESVFKNAGFRIFRPAWFRTFPGMMDGFALNPANGKLIHAHCHFRFVLGEKYLKSFELPWADEVLERRASWSEDSAAYVSDPTDEMVLLLLREALKISPLFKKPSRQNAEFDWLKKRVNEKDLHERASDLLSPACAAIMTELYENGLDFTRLQELQKAARETLIKNGWRRMDAIPATLEQFSRMTFSLLGETQTKLNITWPYLFLRRRALPNGGMIVAILGPDGSGKSTVVDEITQGWNHKIDTVKIYFGLQKLPAFLKKENAAKTPITEVKKGTSWPFIARAVFDAAKKRILMHHANALRKKGALVITDRFPQKQFQGYNDGPLLSHFIDDENKFRRALARWEARQFDALEKITPDMVILLMPSLKKATERKPGENSEKYLSMKMDALKNLRFAEQTKLHTINADRALDDVLMEARTLIWNAIP